MDLIVLPRLPIVRRVMAAFYLQEAYRHDPTDQILAANEPRFYQ